MKIQENHAVPSELRYLSSYVQQSCQFITSLSIRSTFDYPRAIRLVGHVGLGHSTCGGNFIDKNKEDLGLVSVGRLAKRFRIPRVIGCIASGCQRVSEAFIVLHTAPHFFALGVVSTMHPQMYPALSLTAEYSEYLEAPY